MQTVEIMTMNWLGENLTKETIPAVIRNGFAIHRKYRINELEKERWTITHIKSGLACCHRSTLIEAKKTAKAFEKLAINNVAFSDMSACEALSLMPVLIKRWSEIIEKELTDERLSESLDHGAWMADILACAR